MKTNPAMQDERGRAGHPQNWRYIEVPLEFRGPVIRLGHQYDGWTGEVDIGGDVVTVSFADRVAVPQHVMVRVLDNEAVFLNLETEKYFGLDQTGTRMWQLLTAAASIDGAFHELLDEYDVAPELLRANLTELLSRLVDHGLLQIVPANVETPSSI